jgi:hypothetical protein
MSAKDILVGPIVKKDADRICRQLHYSGKVDPRSNFHFGVFYKGYCRGVMQFGPPIDKRKMISLVEDTRWDGFCELNRMAFSETLPRNSESRALGYVLRLLGKQYGVEWVLSFADATQCGDGAIYRAAGFLLTKITKNTSMYRMPDGEICCQLSFTISSSTALHRRYGKKAGESFGEFSKRVGAVKLIGHQLRYLKPLNSTVKSRMTCPVIPYSRIDELGIGMYRGKKRVTSIGIDAAGDHPAEGGETPTVTLQNVPRGTSS